MTFIREMDTSLAFELEVIITMLQSLWDHLLLKQCIQCCDELFLFSAENGVSEDGALSYAYAYELLNYITLSFFQ